MKENYEKFKKEAWQTRKENENLRERSLVTVDSSVEKIDNEKNEDNNSAMCAYAQKM